MASSNKVCTKCLIKKPLSDFYKLSHTKDGYDYKCKSCNYAANKKHRSTISGKKYYSQLQKQYRQSDQYKQYLASDVGVATMRRKKYKRRTLEKKVCQLSAADIQLLSKIFSDRCLYCGDNIKLTYDHVIPLSRGGDTSISNCVIACKSCNSSKGAKLLFLEWTPSNFDLYAYNQWVSLCPKN